MACSNGECHKPHNRRIREVKPRGHHNARTNQKGSQRGHGSIQEPDGFMLRITEATSGTNEH